MKPIELKRELETKLARPHWRFSYNRDEQKLYIEDININKGINVSLSKLATTWQKKKDAALEETIRYVTAALEAMATAVEIKGNEKNIFPIIRATSFPEQTKEGVKLFFEEHTAETRIYYCIDRGETYSLITEEMVEKEQVSRAELQEIALFNMRSLPVQAKTDEVAGNTFYFINHNDGYDASRILNKQLLEEYKTKIDGEMAVAVPHQDVLIICDIKNERGYDVLAQVVFQFFANGTTPITALPFIYDDGELEPVFILAQRKPKQH